ncbi:hypothetical protein BH11PLA2_BH11PLA2_00120 [soil metagenome]
MAAAPTPNDLTRQQLDELDLLLQRMLALPLGKAEPASAPTIIALPEPPPMPSGWRMDTPRPEPVSAPHLNTEPLPEPVLALATSTMAMPAQAMPVPTPMQPVERPALPRVTAPSTAMSDMPASVFGKLDLAELVIPAAAPETTIAVDDTNDDGLPMLMWPFFVVNWIVENVLKLFGPPGQMLTSRPMKNALGIAGVLMILGAGLWTANGKGWISLPVDKVLKR